MILAKPDMEFVPVEIGGIPFQNVCFGVKSLTEEDPAGVRPPVALAGCMGITFLIAELVMYAMCSDPEDRATLERHRSEDAHDVLDPLGGVVAAVGQQAVIAHSDSHVDGENVQNCHDGQALPTKEEEGSEGTGMKNSDGDQRDPVEALFDGRGSAHSSDIRARPHYANGLWESLFVRSRDLFG